MIFTYHGDVKVFVRTASAPQGLLPLPSLVFLFFFIPFFIFFTYFCYSCYPSQVPGALILSSSPLPPRTLLTSTAPLVLTSMTPLAKPLPSISLGVTPEVMPTGFSKSPGHNKGILSFFLSRPYTLFLSFLSLLHLVSPEDANWVIKVTRT